MFEKEAYEYEKEKIDLATSMMNPQIETATRQGFKDGAEFGYNKGLEAGRKEATQRLKNCMNCEKRRTCKTWHLVCGLEAANTANYGCVCLDKWEIAEECEEEE